ncbi:MAG: S24 family peptidase [Candidatus Edwardsbacteria bacterium]|nr:S24 family peptidase [Candidatus Edwardsbacteria bacterium]
MAIDAFINAVRKRSPPALSQALLILGHQGMRIINTRSISPSVSVKFHLLVKLDYRQFCLICQVKNSYFKKYFYMVNKSLLLKELRKELSLTQAEMAKLIGLKWYQIKNIETGKTKLSNQLERVLSFTFNVNPQWLCGNTEQIFINDSKPIIYDGDNPRVIKEGLSEYSAEASVRVPLYNVAAAAGSGCYICQENITGHLLFPHHYIEKVLCVSGKDLLVVTASGDSMVPTINDNDLVMVDQSQKILKSGSVYLLRFDDTLVVKRVQLKPEGMVQIVSDNKMLDPFEIKGSDINVLGKVVWVGGKF